MTLFELQEWLGHSTPAATQHYAKITPTKLAKSYADAGYFARNLRAIDVLVDQRVIRSGRAATEPWKFYDLGHGYCTYDLFDQSPHRMACLANCAFLGGWGTMSVVGTCRTEVTHAERGICSDEMLGHGLYPSVEGGNV
jgi:hypothetical protein